MVDVIPTSKLHGARRTAHCALCAEHRVLSTPTNVFCEHGQGGWQKSLADVPIRGSNILAERHTWHLGKWQGTQACGGMDAGTERANVSIRAAVDNNTISVGSRGRKGVKEKGEERLSKNNSLGADSNFTMYGWDHYFWGNTDLPFSSITYFTTWSPFIPLNGFFPCDKTSQLHTPYDHTSPFEVNFE